MKVLQLVSSIGFFGAENLVVTLAHEQKQSGLTTYIGVFENLINPNLEIVNVAKDYDLPVRIFPCKARFDIKTILDIRDFIKREAIDVIHSHGYKSNFYALFATLFSNVKRIATCHNWLSINSKMKMYEHLDKILLRRFHKVIAVSCALKAEITNSGLSGRKVMVINNGVDLARFTSIENTDNIRKELNLDSNCQVIGTIGRLVADKGNIFLLHAIKRLSDSFPNVKCLIVGDGPEKGNLCFQVEMLGLKDKVIFTGIRNDIPQILNLIDIFVMPSLEEGVPMALLEAMASRKPIIATKVGEIPKMIIHEYSGLLVEPKDSAALYNSLVRLLKDRRSADSFAQNAYSHAVNNYSSKKMVSEYIKTYEEALRQ